MNEQQETAGLASPIVERCVMPEPPWCGWCGGTCECDDNDDDEYMDNLQMAADCKCGAWQISNINQVIHVADCYCDF